MKGWHGHGVYGRDQWGCGGLGCRLIIANATCRVLGCCMTSVHRRTGGGWVARGPSNDRMVTVGSCRA